MKGLSVLQTLWRLLFSLSVVLAASGEDCDPSLCLNGGTCLNGSESSTFYCLCPDGFTGQNCSETEQGPCTPNPCLNNGRCRVVTESRRGDVFAQYVCECPEGYEGPHCQKSISPGNECNKQPCKNGGTCLDQEGGYFCECPSPFMGKSCQSPCNMPLGMEGGAIADFQLSASSTYYSFLGMQRWGPDLARLNGQGIVNAWTASTYDKNPWIQVNLLRKMRITGIMTQGASRTGSSEYLRTFKVGYSDDGYIFKFIQEPSKLRDQVFVGNIDNNGPKANVFDPPLVTQFVRIVPIVCRRACTLRFELYGCEVEGCSSPLGMKSMAIPDKKITASSTFKTFGLDAFSWHPYFARLDKTGKFNAWTAQRLQGTEWLQIELEVPKRVTGIITQGARDFGNIQYVSAYKVAYSNDGKSWTQYKDRRTNTSKIFIGNSDNNSHKKNIFETPFYSRFVRILPVAWHGRITLRVELLGCEG
ncbi:lactadherin isoform X1 [Monodelphis domestica]|uniref:lactadherin isoform X1 n=1 Tax=Monodelphis domestica TaxID=13616 RepID=UPI0024E2049C|nr:lactadherin isoform X1 [Monodelphis domestica]